ncbi:hypothetical protein [Curtobacterium poinsettiae]|uniref:hypothetical protein n=1 Tax=Curtobacterium poinsettiae TaxID=159612 RepID=UPI00235E583B|nr:hypothetical protein [Curtobacterium flaccumfaciens]MDD1386819.1 hypothetical protein [Curtobacterium flaccumfaciens pv. poinsettiae]
MASSTVSPDGSLPDRCDAETSPDRYPFISGLNRSITRRPISDALVALTEHELNMMALGFQPDGPDLPATRLIIPADPTLFLASAAAGNDDRIDNIITVNTLPRAHVRNHDNTSSLEELRNRLHFLADIGHDLRNGLPS